MTIQKVPNGSVVNEVRPKIKSRFDILITRQPSVVKDAQKETEEIAKKYAGVAAMVLIYGNHQVRDGSGYRFIKTDSDQISLYEVFHTYLMRIPGNQVFAICEPNISFMASALQLMARVGATGIGNAWAAYCKAGGEPRMFVMNAQNCEFIVREVPKTVFFNEGGGWDKWMHQFLSGFVRHPRYIDATEYRMISEENVVTNTSVTTQADPYNITNSLTAPIPIRKTKPTAIKKARKD